MSETTDPEKALIGAVLSGYRDLDELCAIVYPTTFEAISHEWIWGTILRVVEAGNRPDPVAVQMAMPSDELKKLPGGALYLLDLAQSCPTVAQARYYAEQVAAAAVRRNLNTAALRIQQWATKPELDVDEMRERARREIDEATDVASVQTATSIADVLPTVLDIAEHGKAAALGTGWPDLDRIIRGIAPGRLMVVGARPGIGKSIMGANLAVHVAAQHQHAALVCSMEMPAEELTQRIIAATADVDLSHLETGMVDERGWERIAKRHQDVLELPITIDDRPAQTLHSIRLAVRDIKRKREDLALVVVDYLQLMRPPDTRLNRVEQVGELSRGLKLLAREQNVCVLALAQLNRESTKSRDGRPRMADLRESGAIEADADVVILLHQPDDDIPEVEVIVDKNRSGMRGICTLQIQGHYARLASVAFHPRGPAA